MNTLKINEMIRADANLLYRVIEALGYDPIRDRGEYFQMANIDGGDNKTAISFYKKTGMFQNWTRGTSGDIFSFVMFAKKCRFIEALDFVVSVLGLDKNSLNAQIQYPFGGFYRHLIATQNEPETNIKTYSEAILSDFDGLYSEMFFRDGISYCSQSKFRVGYDIWSNRITIPEYTFDGRLCGIMGRSNDVNCAHEDRWLPIIPCSRNLTLFGYHRNYSTIQRKNLVVVFESEKSTMQMNTFGSHVALSSCGCHLSNTQVRYLKGLMTKRIILAYDEGLDEELIRVEASKLKTENQILKNRVGYIYDREHDILKRGSKASPSDLGRNAFQKLIKEKVMWL